MMLMRRDNWQTEALTCFLENSMFGVASCYDGILLAYH